MEKGTLDSAREVIPEVLRFIQPRRVIDVGCGTGVWLSVFLETGVDEVLGLDGEWIDREMLLIPQDRFVAVDLTQPLDRKEQFDLVVCLEVAEHLSIACAETFVASLCQLGPVILFSAAIPSQGGEDHVNEQWPDYWAGLFACQGFISVDCLRESIWQNQKVEWWYAQNLLFFVRQDSLALYPELKAWHERTLGFPLSIAHPRLATDLQDQVTDLQDQVTALETSEAYLQQRVADLEQLKPGSISLKTVLRALPALFWNALARRKGRLLHKGDVE